MPTETPTIPITAQDLLDMQMSGHIPEHAPVCETCGTVIISTTEGWRHLLRVDTHRAWPATPETDAQAVVDEPATLDGVTTIPVTTRALVQVTPHVRGTGHVGLTLRCEAARVMLTLSLTRAQATAVATALQVTGQP